MSRMYDEQPKELWGPGVSIIVGIILFGGIIALSMWASDNNVPDLDVPDDTGDVSQYCGPGGVGC